MKIKIFYPYLRFTNLLFLLILFNACSKTDDPTDFGDIEFNGSYNLTITGDESRTITGESNFLHVVNSSESQGGMGAILTISLLSGEEEAISISLMQSNPKEFTKGSFSFIEEPTEGEVFFSSAFYSSQTMFTYLIASGQIELTKVQNTSIEGNLNIVMTDNNGLNINISGTFKAVGITQKF